MGQKPSLGRSYELLHDDDVAAGVLQQRGQARIVAVTEAAQELDVEGTDLDSLSRGTEPQEKDDSEGQGTHHAARLI